MRFLSPSVAAVTLFCLFAGVACDRRDVAPMSKDPDPSVVEGTKKQAQDPEVEVPDPPETAGEPLDPAVVAAWERAGAKAGWYSPDKLGRLQFFEAMPTGSAGLPAFECRHVKPGAIGNLPAPAKPFALYFAFAYLDDARLKDLAGLESLQGLNLHGTDVTDIGMKELRGLTNLQSLILANNKGVTDAGVKQIAGLTNMRILVLAGTGVSDSGLKELAALQSLRTLDLMGTQVTDAGLKELGRLTRLKHLDASFTKVGDDQLTDLANARSLRYVDLAFTRVTDSGVARLQKAHAKLKIRREHQPVERIRP